MDYDLKNDFLLFAYLNNPNSLNALNESMISSIDKMERTI